MKGFTSTLVGTTNERIGHHVERDICVFKIGLFRQVLDMR